jgi:carbon storage regulator
MLVLTRRLGESIIIGDDIEVTIVRVTPTEVRLGVEAPPGSIIYRRELGQERETGASESADPPDLL